MTVNSIINNQLHKKVVQTLRLAILMTCHNRRAKTLACLEALSQQKLPSGLEIQIYLVDDGCSDGTAEAVHTNYPEVKILPGSGYLFWNGGMRLAFDQAVKYDYDYYLWLNDDTMLYSQAIDNLLKTSQHVVEKGYVQTVVVGSTQDIKTGVLSYGGLVQSSWWHPFRFALVEPGEEAKPCLTMHGNCVLISREVVQAVGILDSAFIHSIGDIDYGLRTQKQSGSVWVAPGYIGTCEYNPLLLDAWNEPHLTLWERWQKINQPRGLLIQEWKVFARRHAGLLWPLYWLLPYLRLLLKSIVRF